ncbi:MAG: murein hydrolase activator EnvC family protein, partial [Dehalococcoidia bacterium]
PAPTAATGPGYDGLLSVGAPVQVAGTGSCLNARAQPGGDTINACLAEGFVGTVADGPRYVNGYWWWQIEGQGWSVDNYLRLYDGTAPATTGPVSNSGFIWPVSGSITDGFGVPRGGNAYHTGIDIDVPDGSHTAVAAAAGGRVVFVAQRSYGYGYHVIIDHGDGFETLYAHLSSIAVEVGQQVSQGALIGYTGCTGYCTGEHLHFEVRKGGAPVNPLSYLP